MKNISVEIVKGWLVELKDYFIALPLHKKIILGIIVIVVKFILPDLIAFPILLKFVRRNKPLEVKFF